MSIKQIAENRNNLLEQARKIKDSVLSEGRAYTEEEAEQVQNLLTQIDALDGTVSSAKKIQDKYNATPDSDPKKAEYKNKLEQAQKEKAEFAKYLKAKFAGNTIVDVNMTRSASGDVIPSTITADIITKLKNYSPIVSAAHRYITRGNIDIPVYDDTSNAINMSYAEEFTELSSSIGFLDSVQLTSYLAGALVLVSRSLINNSNIDIVEFVVQQMAFTAAYWLEGECLHGTNNKIVGMSGLSNTVTAAATAAITSDEIIDLEEAVNSNYRSNCCYIMAKNTLKAIRKLKDSTGNYLYQRDATSKFGATINGYPVYISDNMPAMAASARCIYFGDLSGLALKISEDVSVEVLLERYADQHAVGLHMWMDADAKVENHQKLSCLVMHA